MTEVARPKRYFFPEDETHLRFGRTSWLRHAPEDGVVGLVPWSHFALARLCQGIKTLDEHAESCRRSLGWQGRAEGGTGAPHTVDLEQMRQQLDRCVRVGLLQPEELLVRSTSLSTANRSPGISVLAIPTADRPAVLGRAVRSYLAAQRTSVDSLEMLITDDSVDPAVRAETRALLLGLQDKRGAALHYSGVEEKRRFAHALVEESGVAQDTITFALFGDEVFGSGPGRNRNAILLETLDRLVLMVDDDSLPATAALDGWPGLGLAAKDNPCEMWFFRDRSEAMGHCTLTRESLAKKHEGVLGRSLGECVQAFGRDGLLSEDLGHRLLRSLRTGRGRILFTLTGVLGDCGFGSPSYLPLRGESRARLVESPERYASACSSREVLRLVRQTTISAAPHCMGSGLGLDNRVLLPPFFPVLRNEDGLFGETMARCYEDGFAAHVPMALLHSPPVSSTFEPGSIWRAPAGVSMSDVVAACIRSAPQPAATEDGALRLKRLGEHLIQLTGGSYEAYTATVRDWLLRAKCAYVELLDDALAEEGERPEYWAADVRRAISAVEDALRHQDWDVPRDVLPGESSDLRRDTARRGIQRYGRLLRGWHRITEAARALNARGRRIAVRLD